MGSNFDEVDAHVNGPADFDEIPELTDADFARGRLMSDGAPLVGKKTKPAREGAARQVMVRLDSAVVEGFRATGSGWEVRINNILRQWLAGRST